MDIKSMSHEQREFLEFLDSLIKEPSDKVITRKNKTNDNDTMEE